MFKRILLSVCLFGLSHITLAKSLALSFDDGLDPKLNPDALNINNEILSTLKQNKIPAILYPSLSRVGAEDGLDIVAEWGKQGHRIGNHANLHLNLNKNEITLPNYLRDMQQGHNAFKALKGFTPRYRFPYLKEGDTLEKRDGVRQWLKINHCHSKHN